MSFDEFAINLATFRTLEKTGTFETLYRRIQRFDLTTMFGVKEQIRAELKRLESIKYSIWCTDSVLRKGKALEALWFFLIEKIDEVDIIRILTHINHYYSGVRP